MIEGTPYLAGVEQADGRAVTQDLEASRKGLKLPLD
jgi:hypothetical protein